MNVVLLHGLARSSRAMRPLGRALAGAGHELLAIDYPSRARRLRDCAAHVLDAIAARGWDRAPDTLAFVGHSMGGLVFRALPLVQPDFHAAAAVLLGSPLTGSLLAASLAPRPLGRLVFGPALQDLSPDAVAGLPPPPAPFGVIAGDRPTWLLPGTWLLARLAPGRPSDSTVLLEETRHPAAADHLVVPRAHSFLMGDREVQRQVLHFLQHRRFFRAGETTGAPT